VELSRLPHRESALDIAGDHRAGLPASSRMTWSMRAATHAEDGILVRHCRAIWQGYGGDDINIRTEAGDLTNCDR